MINGIVQAQKLGHAVLEVPSLRQNTVQAEITTEAKQLVRKNIGSVCG